MTSSKPREDNAGKRNCLGVEGTVDIAVTELVETNAGNREQTQWA